MTSLSNTALKNEKSKSKFLSININNMYLESRGESAESQKSQKAPNPKPGFQLLGKVSNARRPANLPSVKSEKSSSENTTGSSNVQGWNKQESAVVNLSSNSGAAAAAATLSTNCILNHPITNASSNSLNLQFSHNEKSWSSITSSGSEISQPPPFQSPQFQHEFPSLSADSNSTTLRNIESSNPVLVPSLRPQSEGFWTNGGGSSQSTKIDNKSSLSMSPTSLSLVSGVGQPIFPNFGPTRNTIAPPFLNKNYLMSGGSSQQSSIGLKKYSSGVGQQQQQQTSKSEVVELIAKPILNQDELCKMDVMTRDTGWATREDIDYNQKLSFSDDETNENTNTKSPHKTEEMKVSVSEPADERKQVPVPGPEHRVLVQPDNIKSNIDLEDDDVWDERRVQQSKEIAMAAERAKRRKEEEEQKYMAPKTETSSQDSGVAKDQVTVESSSSSKNRDNFASSTRSSDQPQSVPVDTSNASKTNESEPKKRIVDNQATRQEMYESKTSMEHYKIFDCNDYEDEVSPMTASVQHWGKTQISHKPWDYASASRDDRKMPRSQPNEPGAIAGREERRQVPGPITKEKLQADDLICRKSELIALKSDLSGSGSRRGVVPSADAAPVAKSSAPFTTDSTRSSSRKPEQMVNLNAQNRMTGSKIGEACSAVGSQNRSAMSASSGSGTGASRTKNETKSSAPSLLSMPIMMPMSMAMSLAPQSMQPMSKNQLAMGQANLAFGKNSSSVSMMPSSSSSAAATASSTTGKLPAASNKTRILDDGWTFASEDKSEKKATSGRNRGSDKYAEPFESNKMSGERRQRNHKEVSAEMHIGNKKSSSDRHLSSSYGEKKSRNDNRYWDGSNAAGTGGSLTYSSSGYDSRNRKVSSSSSSTAATATMSYKNHDYNYAYEYDYKRDYECDYGRDYECEYDYTDRRRYRNQANAAGSKMQPSSSSSGMSSNAKRSAKDMHRSESKRNATDAVSSRTKSFSKGSSRYDDDKKSESTFSSQNKESKEKQPKSEDPNDSNSEGILKKEKNRQIEELNQSRTGGKKDNVAGTTAASSPPTQSAVTSRKPEQSATAIKKSKSDLSNRKFDKIDENYEKSSQYSDDGYSKRRSGNRSHEYYATASSATLPSSSTSSNKRNGRNSERRQLSERNSQWPKSGKGSLSSGGAASTYKNAGGYVDDSFADSREPDYLKNESAVKHQQKSSDQKTKRSGQQQQQTQTGSRADNKDGGGRSTYSNVNKSCDDPHLAKSKSSYAGSGSGSSGAVAGSGGRSSKKNFESGKGQSKGNSSKENPSLTNKIAPAVVRNVWDTRILKNSENKAASIGAESSSKCRISSCSEKNLDFDGSTAPVNTIIFENTNLKSIPGSSVGTANAANLASSMLGDSTKTGKLSMSSVMLGTANVKRSSLAGDSTHSAANAAAAAAASSSSSSSSHQEVFRHHSAVQSKHSTDVNKKSLSVPQPAISSSSSSPAPSSHPNSMANLNMELKLDFGYDNERAIRSDEKLNASQMATISNVQSELNKKIQSAKKIWDSNVIETPVSVHSLVGAGATVVSTATTSSSVPATADDTEFKTAYESNLSFASNATSGSAVPESSGNCENAHETFSGSANIPNSSSAPVICKVKPTTQTTAQSAFNIASASCDDASGAAAAPSSAVQPPTVVQHQQQQQQQQPAATTAQAPNTTGAVAAAAAHLIEQKIGASPPILQMLNSGNVNLNHQYPQQFNANQHLNYPANLNSNVPFGGLSATISSPPTALVLNSNQNNLFASLPIDQVQNRSQYAQFAPAASYNMAQPAAAANHLCGSMASMYLTAATPPSQPDIYQSLAASQYRMAQNAQFGQQSQTQSQQVQQQQQQQQQQQPQSHPLTHALPPHSLQHPHVSQINNPSTVLISSSSNSLMSASVKQSSHHHQHQQQQQQQQQQQISAIGTKGNQSSYQSGPPPTQQSQQQQQQQQQSQQQQQQQQQPPSTTQQAPQQQQLFMAAAAAAAAAYESAAIPPNFLSNTNVLQRGALSHVHQNSLLSSSLQNPSNNFYSNSNAVAAAAAAAAAAQNAYYSQAAGNSGLHQSTSGFGLQNNLFGPSQNFGSQFMQSIPMNSNNSMVQQFRAGSMQQQNNAAAAAYLKTIGTDIRSGRNPDHMPSYNSG